jgi:hypothetical protein
MNAAERSRGLLRVGGKTGGAVWVCLDFLAPPFVSRQKVGKHTSKEIMQSVKEKYGVLKKLMALYTTHFLPHY